MDDRYAIRLAKTKLRDAYDEGDLKGVLSVFADAYSDMSAGLASFYGTEAQAVLKHRMKKLFARYHAQLAVTIISIQVQAVGFRLGLAQAHPDTEERWKAIHNTHAIPRYLAKGRYREVGNRDFYRQPGRSAADAAERGVNRTAGWTQKGESSFRAEDTVSDWIG